MKNEDVKHIKAKTKPEAKPDIKTKSKPFVSPKPHNDIKNDSKCEKNNDKQHEVEEKKTETSRVSTKPKPLNKCDTPNNLNSFEKNKNEKPKVNSKEGLNEKPVTFKKSLNDNSLKCSNILSKKPERQVAKKNISELVKSKPELTKHEPEEKVKSESTQGPILPVKNKKHFETINPNNPKTLQQSEKEIKYKGVDGLFYVKLEVQKETSKAPRKPAKPPNVSLQSLVVLVEEDNDKRFENSFEKASRNSESDESFGIREEWEEEEELRRMKAEECNEEVSEEEFYEEL